MPPKRAIVVTANDSHYEVDDDRLRVRKLFRKYLLGQGSKTLEDGQWHSYDRLSVLEIGSPMVLYWPNGKALVTSHVKTLIERMDDEDEA